MDAINCEYIVYPGVIAVKTEGELDVKDLSRDLSRLVKESAVREGTAHLFVAGSTAVVTTIEFEPGAVSDLKASVSRLAPRNIRYAHDARWGDGNGRSHVRAALIGPSLTVPVREGAPLLGTWQQAVLLELDLSARNRTVHVTIAGVRASAGGGL